MHEIAVAVTHQIQSAEETTILTYFGTTATGGGRRDGLRGENEVGEALVKHSPSYSDHEIIVVVV